MTKPIAALQINSDTDNPFPEIFHQKMGVAEVRGLSDHFGLSAFGVNLECVKPGGSSGLKHWHTRSEEFVYIVSGMLTLHFGEERFELKQGSCIGFKANEKVGHRLVNETNLDAMFMVVGSRVEHDKALYDEDDFQWLVDKNGQWLPAKKDGTLY